ncbi:MAG: GGDEF domain-containing protein, partial [Phycisphaerales bacterium]
GGGGRPGGGVPVVSAPIQAARGRASDAVARTRDGNDAPHAPTAPIPPHTPRERLPAFEMPRSNHGSPEPTRDGPPGDIDLVKALLDGGDLHAAALRVLRHHLGTADVRFLADPRPGEEAAVSGERASLRQVPVAAADRRFGVLVSATLDEATLSAWSQWLAHWLQLEASHDELRRLAWTDELTGAGNRRAFERLLADSIATARRERRALSLMFFDIDDFKKYNDEFGHDAGDEVLRETVELLRSSIRRGDHVFRIGGDEFVVLFCDASGPRAGGNGIPESVEDVARRFQKAVCDLRFPQLGLDGPGTISISAGLAAFPWDGHDAASLLRHADLLAIESKRAGKNVITFGPGARRFIEGPDA